MVSCLICYNKNNDHVQLTLDHLKQHKHEKFVPIKCPYPGCDTKRFTQLLLLKKHLQRSHFSNNNAVDSQFIDVESNFDDVCMIDDDNITVEEVQTLEESDFEEEELLPDEININKILIEKRLHRNTSFMAAYFEQMFSKLVLENPSAPFTLIESFMDLYGDCLDMFAPIEIVQTYNKLILKKKILRRNEINIQGIELMEPEEENDNEDEYIEAFNCNSDFQDDYDIGEELDNEATNKLIQRRIKSSRNRRNAYMLPIEELIKLNENLYIEDNKLNCLLFFDEFCSGNLLSVGVGSHFF